MYTLDLKEVKNLAEGHVDSTWWSSGSNPLLYDFNSWEMEILSFVPPDISVQLQYESVIIMNKKVLYRGKISLSRWILCTGWIVTGIFIILEGEGI